MTITPAWIAATPGTPGMAGQVNQFLTGHNATFLYGGAVQSSQLTGSGTYVTTAGNWYAQQFTATTDNIGSVWLQINAVGGSPVNDLIDPFTVSVYADDGTGTPTGDPLASATVSSIYIYSAPTWVPFPLTLTGLTPGTVYLIVTQPAGNGTHYYAWQQSGSGAYTCTDGVLWEPAGYGLAYQVLDQSATGPLSMIVEDAGARWTQLTYDGSGRIATVTEYTTAQGGSSLLSSRTLAYSGGLLIGVS